MKLKYRRFIRDYTMANYGSKVSPMSFALGLIEGIEQLEQQEYN